MTMILVEQCESWHEMDMGSGRHCWNCIHRDGFPQRAQPSPRCENYCKRQQHSLSICCKRCHEISPDKKCHYCRHPAKNKDKSIMTDAGKVYTWLYMPHSKMVVFYDKTGNDIGYLDTESETVCCLTGTPIHPDLAEVAEKYKASTVK